jgi:hypothetical protein
MPKFFTVGQRIFNTAHIVSVNIRSGKRRCVEVETLTKTRMYYEDKEETYTQALELYDFFTEAANA